MDRMKIKVSIGFYPSPVFNVNYIIGYVSFHLIRMICFVCACVLIQIDFTDEMGKSLSSLL